VKGTSKRVIRERVGATFEEESGEASIACHQYIEERHCVRVCAVDGRQLCEGWPVPLYCPSQGVILRLLALFVAKKEFHQAVEPGREGNTERRFPGRGRNY
jgi:hypothetical protein